MARPRSPNRSRAYELWIESNKKRRLKDIAEELQISEEQIRKWKNQDKWDKVTLPKTKSNVTNHKGGQIGNKNATGNKGGAAPVGNKNAVKTGEFETLFFDALEPEEMHLIGMVQLDKEKLLLEEIQLLTVRERRMLKRIEGLKSLDDMPEMMKGGELDEPPLGMTITKYSSGYDKGKLTNLKEYEGTLGQIQAIEDSLTRVQARRQRAIETLHKFRYDDARLDLESAKFELELTKQGGQGDKTEEDGFMNAINDVASSAWGETYE